MRPEAEPAPGARLDVSRALDVSAEAPQALGRLPLDVPVPSLPDELAAPLSPRDVRMVWELVRGSTWGEALDAVDYPKRGQLRDSGIPPTIQRAAEHLVGEIAKSSAVSRAWIQGQLVALYRRAAQAEPVLDRKGVPTGVYRFDGATARGCLRDLGEDIGMFGKGKSGLAVSDVASLLAAVASTGRPTLPADRARVVPGQVVRDRPARALEARRAAPTAAPLRGTAAKG